MPRYERQKTERRKNPPADCDVSLFRFPTGIDDIVYNAKYNNNNNN